jgi:hypothetical protein
MYEHWPIRFYRVRQPIEKRGQINEEKLTKQTNRTKNKINKGVDHSFLDQTKNTPAVAALNLIVSWTQVTQVAWML